MSKTVLIVEDDVFVAMDLAEQLSLEGFTVLGPCVNSRSALELFEQEACDIAVLDINLGDETSEPVAFALKSSGVPFVVASGYSIEQFPEVFVGAPSLNKPIQTDALVSLLKAA